MRICARTAAHPGHGQALACVGTNGMFSIVLRAMAGLGGAGDLPGGQHRGPWAQSKTSPVVAAQADKSQERQRLLAQQLIPHQTRRGLPGGARPSPWARSVGCDLSAAGLGWTIGCGRWKVRPAHRPGAASKPPSPMAVELDPYFLERRARAVWPAILQDAAVAGPSGTCDGPEVPAARPSWMRWGPSMVRGRARLVGAAGQGWAAPGAVPVAGRAQRAGRTPAPAGIRAATGPPGTATGGAADAMRAAPLHHAASWSPPQSTQHYLCQCGSRAATGCHRAGVSWLAQMGALVQPGGGAADRDCPSTTRPCRAPPASSCQVGQPGGG